MNTELAPDNWIQNQLAKGTGASLYLIETNQYLTDSEPLVQWCWQLLTRLYRPHSNWASHPDVLFLNHEGSNFKTIQLDDIFNFLKTRAVELDQKYIVVSNVLGLSPLAQNKLLKVLEEPPVKATFFFLNPNKIKMLETIHSRAQKARVIIAKQEQELIKPSEILTCGLVEFQEQYKSDWKQIRSIIEAFGQYLPHNAIASEELAQIYQIYSHDITYNNSSSYLAYKIYRFAQKWFADHSPT